MRSFTGIFSFGNIKSHKETNQVVTINVTILGRHLFFGKKIPYGKHYMYRCTSMM